VRGDPEVEDAQPGLRVRVTSQAKFVDPTVVRLDQADRLPGTDLH
jgi:hypothetical protein